MPIDIELLHEGAGVIYNCHGTMTFKDFYDASNGFLDFPDELRKWRYAIIDLTAVECMNLSYGEVASIVEQNKRHAAGAPPGTLLAVSSPRDLGFGIARMWEALVEQVGWETQTFRSRAEAALWIKQRAKQKFGIELGDHPAHT
jgi:hypothetical protein